MLWENQAAQNTRRPIKPHDWMVVCVFCLCVWFTLFIFFEAVASPHQNFISCIVGPASKAAYISIIPFEFLAVYAWCSNNCHTAEAETSFLKRGRHTCNATQLWGGDGTKDVKTRFLAA